jgi:hypothetical protein
MSAKIFGLAWELELPHAEKFVLLALADHADHDGNNVFPSIALVAWKTEYSERQVQRVMKKLEARGLLVREQDGGLGPRSTTRYRINLDVGKFRERPNKGDKMSPLTHRNPPPKGDNSQPVRVTFATAKGDTAMSPESKAIKNRTFPQKSPSVEIVRGAACTGLPEVPRWASCSDGAGDFRNLIQRKLEGAGYETRCEALVFDRGDGSAGRIDIVAKRGEEILAIECDRQQPREKSIAKLTAYDATRRLIVLREPAIEFADFPLFDDMIGAQSA